MLTDAFSKYGNIEHATILTTTHGDDQASPVYGFVQFENEYDCNAALSAVPPFIGDQQVEVHLAKLNPEVKDTIYVTGFDSSVKESQLLAHFKKYNPTDIHIGKQKSDGKAYALIQFSNEYDRVDAIVNLNGSQMDDATLTVRFSLIQFSKNSEL